MDHRAKLSFLSYSKLKGKEFSGLSTFQFLLFFRRNIVYTFLAIYLRSLGLSTTEVTLMASVGMIANAGTQALVWGKALDKYQKPVEFVSYGEFLAGVGHIFMVFGYQFFLGTSQLYAAGYVIILAMGIIEVFWSMSNVGWSALVSELTELDERKKIMGQFSIIGGFGGIAGAYVGGLLFDNGVGFSNGSIFFIAAFAMIISSIIVIFSVRIKDSLGSGDTVDDTVLPSLNELPQLLRRSYLIFIIALIFINFGRNSIAVITGLFLAEPTAFGATGEEIALFSNVGSIATIITGILIGSVVAKRDDNKVLFVGVLIPMVGIGWLIFTPTFVLS
ncbi:MAG: MFS transporter, partial [Candidatus Thorarchaeota archaeon]